MFWSGRRFDRDRVCDRGRAGVADVVAHQPAKHEQVRGLWSGEFRQKAAGWSGDGQEGFVKKRAHHNMFNEALNFKASAIAIAPASPILFRSRSRRFKTVLTTL